MKIVDVQAAVDGIHEACAGKKVPYTPFFFITGAGLSAPNVKLASLMEEELRTRALARRPETPPPANDDAMSRYAYWFEEAIGSKEGRRQYLEEQIRGKAISASNFRLALLLFGAKLGNLVLTPNFDDFLSRSLTLFGRPHIVIDHPYAAERMNPESAEIQIVHVHGTYWFYDCANLTSEIVGRKKKLKTSITISDRLDALLFNRVPIVIGYSGWEKDLIMTALAKRLRSGGLPTPLYWFCYSKADFDALPTFIEKHDDVRVVLRKRLIDSLKSGGRASIAAVEMVSQLTSPLGGTNIPTPAGLVETARKVAAADVNLDVLPADMVLKRLVEKMAPEPPLLVTNPLRFFADQLKSAFPNTVENDVADVLWFRRTIRRVEESNETPAYAFDATLDPSVDAFRRGLYPEALAKASALVWTEASRAQKLELADLLLEASDAIDKDDAHTRDGYRMASEIYQHLGQALALAPPQQERLGRSLYRGAAVAEALGEPDAAIGTWERLIDGFKDSNGLEIERNVARAMLRLAVAKNERGNADEAIALLDTLDRRFSASTDDSIRLVLAHGLSLQGHFRLLAGELTASGTVFDELTRRFGTSNNETVRAAVASGLVGHATALAHAGKVDEAVARYRDLIRNFAESKNETVLNQIVTAYGMSVSMLIDRGDGDLALSLANEAQDRFASATDPGAASRAIQVRWQLAMALVRKGQFDRAIEVADSVTANEPTNDGSEWGYFMAALVRAIALEAAGRSTEADRALEDLIQRHEGSANSLQMIAAVSALNQRAALLSKHGKRELALEVLARAATYSGSALAVVRLQAALARVRRAKLLLESDAEEGLQALAEISSDERLYETEQLRGMAAAAAVDRTAWLMNHGRDPEALVECDLIVDRFDAFNDATSQMNVVNALWNGSHILRRQGKAETARIKLEALLQRSARHPEMAQRTVTAKVSLALIEANESHFPVANQLLDEAESTAAAVIGPLRLPLMVHVRVNRASSLLLETRTAEAAAILDSVLADPQALTHPLLLDEVAFAYDHTTVQHLQLKEFELVLSKVEQGISWARGNAMDRLAAGLLVRKGAALFHLERHEESRNVAEEIVHRFKDSPDAGVQEYVSIAQSVLAEAPPPADRAASLGQEV